MVFTARPRAVSALASRSEGELLANRWTITFAGAVALLERSGHTDELIPLFPDEILVHHRPKQWVETAIARVSVQPIELLVC